MGSSAALVGVAIAAAALASPPAAAQVVAPGSSVWRPADVALDAQDNIYIADIENHRILKVRDGVVTSIAGTGTAGYSGDGGPATSARLNTPSGLSVDGDGNIYIADTSNHRVRKISPTGTISTLAGTGTAGYNGDGSAATSRQLNYPTGVSVDGSGNVYIADRHNHRVRRVSAAGAISTFAGTGVEGNIWGTDGPQAATTVQLAQPTDVAVGGDGHIYIADRRSSKVRKVSTAGTLRTHYTNRDSTRLWGVAADSDGNVYVADWTPTGSMSSLIRRITAAGSHSIFAGYGGADRSVEYPHGFRGDGGPATATSTPSAALTLLDLPRGVAVDSSGNVYIADTDNYRIRKVDAGTGNISTVVSTYGGPNRTVIETFAGGAMGFAGDGGPAASARLNEAEGVAVDSSGNVYIADTDNHRIRKVDAGTGNISTIAGTGTAGYGGDGGAANQAQINAPKGVHVDSSGNVYIADTSNNRVRKVDAAGTISTIAGNGTQGFGGDGGAATSSMLWWPADVATDASGNVYIADWANQRIRKVDAAGTISTFVADASYCPTVAVDASGNVYFPFGNRVDKVDGQTGVRSNFAGNGQPSSRGSFGGARLSASLWGPTGVAVDASGNVYMTTATGRRVYKVLAGSGIITLVAGSGIQGFGGDGGPATSAQFENLHGVAVDPSGNNVYVADFGNNRIRLARSPLSFASEVSAKRFAVGRRIALFEVPEAVGGEGTVRYAARGLPPGLWFDEDGRGQCGLRRSVCGTPSEEGSWSVSVTARDDAGATAALTFRAEVASDVEAGPPPVIPDAALLSAVAAALGLPAGLLTETDLLSLESLNAAWSGVSSLEGLSAASNLKSLYLRGNALTNLEGLSSLALLTTLDLSDNDLTDVSALSDLTRLRALLLSGNRIADAGSLSGLSALRELSLDGNPLEDVSALALLAALEWLSLRDVGDSGEAPAGTPGSKAAVAGGRTPSGLPSLCALSELRWLALSNNGLSDIGWLSCLTDLTDLELSDNAIADIGPLSSLRSLERLNLERNRVSEIRALRPLKDLTRLRLADNAVSDVSPLAENDGLGEGDVAGLRGNPLSAASLDRLPALRTRGAAVLAGVSLPLFPSSSDAWGVEGFARVANRSEEDGVVLIEAVDGAGRRFGPARLSLSAGSVVHFNTDDLENGNAAKGLTGLDGAPGSTGSWRLELLSALEVEALSYARTSDGFVTDLSASLPRDDVAGALRASVFNPGSNWAQRSSLRLLNPGGRSERIVVWGVDDAGWGRLAEGLSVPAGGSLTARSAELERGLDPVGRGLGSGEGKWRLAVHARWPVEGSSLLASPSGHLTNLSSAPPSDADGVWRAPLFPSASGAAGRRGFVRISNRSWRGGEVRITGTDDGGNRSVPLTLTLKPFETAHLNSNDWERGNAAKGLPEGAGPPASGSWRLALESELDVRVAAFVRHDDGFLTSMGTVAPRDAAASGDAASVSRVWFFNPGSNRNQESLLRLINDGASAATVTISGVDDAGAEAPGGSVSVTVAAGAALTLSAWELENGGSELEGALGDGEGKWRLTVSSDAAVAAMSLLSSPTDHLTNLSGAPRGAR